jgi:arginyl-tRNA--protein-N-Asp/Glu arginylyltransferase
MTQKYLSWGETTVDPLNTAAAEEAYNKGALFTRVEPQKMTLTRSVRVNLKKFSLSSENRRILRKNENISLSTTALPSSSYTWEIGKLAKDFYDTKFGKDIFSANAIKKLCTEPHNFNTLFVYSENEKPLGYAICYMTKNVLHYSYPFYELNRVEANIGIGMMTKAIAFAQEKGLSYVYLGSLQRPTDTYKLQFEGIEWFDEHTQSWSSNLIAAKTHLNSDILQA